MKNLFKFMCVITFLFGSFAFAQNSQNERKKPDVKIKYCKKFHVSVGIGVITVDTDVIGCLVTVEGVPMMWWARQQQPNNPDRLDYLYVEEQEMIKALNVKDSGELEHMKILKSQIWDFEGVNYVINPSIKYEVIEVKGIKYYALPIQVIE